MLFFNVGILNGARVLQYVLKKLQKAKKCRVSVHLRPGRFQHVVQTRAQLLLCGLQSRGEALPRDGPLDIRFREDTSRVRTERRIQRWKQTALIIKRQQQHQGGANTLKYYLSITDAHNTRMRFTSDEPLLAEATGLGRLRREQRRKPGGRRREAATGARRRTPIQSRSRPRSRAEC
jgi:hypothetical protein